MSNSDLSFLDDEYKFEKNFWGTCVNTYGEETKQWVYAHLMGLSVENWAIDVGGKSILDIGGGPSSMLLKCRNKGTCVVADPIRYPEWVYDRYKAHGVVSITAPGETLHMSGFDEVWIYNVLQHCADPEKIIANARKAAKILRIFEWVNIPPHEGHPQMLTKEDLDRWTRGNGTINELNVNGCVGTSYSGVYRFVS